MNIIFSVPSGFHARELLVPLKPLLDADTSINHVYCLTPGAPFRQELFSDYGDKFTFIANPLDEAGLKKLISELAPDIVVTNTSGLDLHDTPLLKATQVLNIPTLTFIASWDNVWKMERFQNAGQPFLLADRLIVWNEMMSEHLKRIFPELNEKRISIIGAPRLDFFFHQDKIPNKKQLLAYLDLPDNDAKLIHFATTELYPLEYVIKTIVEAQRKGAIKHKLHLYASVHPGGDIGKHRQYADKYHVTVRYSFGRRSIISHPSWQYNPTPEEIYMLVALFKHSNLLINHSSTVAIESFLGDTPVINVKYGQPLDWWRWYRSMVYRDFKQHYRDVITNQATKVVHNSHQLIAAVCDYLDHPEHDQQNRLATLKKMITTTDGTASKKVLDIIKNTAKS